MEIQRHAAKDQKHGHGNYLFAIPATSNHARYDNLKYGGDNANDGGDINIVKLERQKK